MAVSYNKLWKLLIDRIMEKKDMHSVAGISSILIIKFWHDAPVITTVLMKICTVLQCDIGDIMEIIPDEQRTYDCRMHVPSARLNFK